jgi:hypothetical protein
MDKHTFQINFDDLNLDVVKIERIIGFKQGESPEIVSKLISEVLTEAKIIRSIKAEFRIFDNIVFDVSQWSISIFDQLFRLGKIIYNQIKKSDSAALFLCTAGEEFGIRSTKAMKNGDLLRGYIYDVLGSEIVETAAELMQNMLEERMVLSGRNITNRFSPGYCGWDVADQHKLFSLMPDNFCGIRLNESALMDPVKSVSGIIGLGENVKRRPYTCSFCDMQDCIYRNKRASVSKLRN